MLQEVAPLETREDRVAFVDKDVLLSCYHHCISA